MEEKDSVILPSSQQTRSRVNKQQSVMTIFNCGTNFDEMNDDLIPTLFLNAQTDSLHSNFILAGPGSIGASQSGYNPFGRQSDESTSMSSRRARPIRNYGTGKEYLSESTNKESITTLNNFEIKHIEEQKKRNYEGTFGSAILGSTLNIFNALGGNNLRKQYDKFSQRIEGISIGTDHMRTRVIQLINHLEELKRKDHLPDVINLIGWSRGAVTCYAMGRELSHIFPTIKLNIFAIDPVPGPGNCIDEFLKIGNLTGKHCAILMRNDYTPIFHLALPTITKKNDTEDYIAMPGWHGTPVRSSHAELGQVNRKDYIPIRDSTPEGQDAVATLTRHMAEQFLTSCGTPLKDTLSLSAEQICHLYNIVANNLKSLVQNNTLKARDTVAFNQFNHAISYCGREVEFLEQKGERNHCLLPLPNRCFINQDHSDNFKELIDNLKKKYDIKENFIDRLKDILETNESQNILKGLSEFIDYVKNNIEFIEKNDVELLNHTIKSMILINILRTNIYEEEIFKPLEIAQGQKSIDELLEPMQKRANQREGLSESENKYPNKKEKEKEKENDTDSDYDNNHGSSFHI